MRHLDAFHTPRFITGIRVGRVQLDYRHDGWLPLSVRRGKRKWIVVPIGKGCVTLALTSKALR